MSFVDIPSSFRKTFNFKENKLSGSPLIKLPSPQRLSGNYHRQSPFPSAGSEGQNKYCKKVRFGKQKVLHFRRDQPAKTVNEATPLITLKPLNCEDRVGKGEWLSDLAVLRTAPFCRLDYLKSYNKYTLEDDSLFHLEGGEDSMENIDIIGEVAVYNVDYCKKVTIKYSFDDWKNVKSTEGHYCGCISTLRIDKFKFCIDPVTERNFYILKMAICYEVGGSVFWDNNDGKDYQFSVLFSSMEPLLEETWLEEDPHVVEVDRDRNLVKFESVPIPITLNEVGKIRFSSLPTCLEQPLSTAAAYYSMVSSWDPAKTRNEQLILAGSVAK